MNQPREITYSLDDPSELEGVLKRLDDRFSVEEIDTAIEQRVYYDSFDWRLYRNGLLFYRKGGRLYLEDFSGRGVAEAKGRKQPKYFWWDITGAEFSRGLQEKIAMRALCPLAEISVVADHFRLLNKDRKTIARIILQRDTVSGADGGSALPELLCIQEIRGYESTFEAIIDFCRQENLKACNRREHLTRIYTATDHSVLDYGGKFRVDLEPEIDIGHAFSKINLHLLGNMEQNHGGVCADIDSEFLHDFRIAVRRTRSLLSLTKKILPAPKRAYFQQEFRWLGSVTGPLRDVDVYLLEKQNYLDQLPESLQDGMEVFFEELRTNRGHELKLLRQHLKSERYLNLLRDWRLFLSDPDSELFSDIRTGNCRDFADTLISERYKRFLRCGKKIKKSSPDRDLHHLRIQGKKLRYLLEFFKSFYPEKKIDKVLKHMKRLQDKLGIFNDLSVQQCMLEARLDSLRSRNIQIIRLAAALGGLIALLGEQHSRVRNEFEATYARFAKAGVSELLQSMDARSTRPEADSP